MCSWFASLSFGGYIFYYCLCALWFMSSMPIIAKGTLAPVLDGQWMWRSGETEEYAIYLQNAIDLVDTDAVVECLQLRFAGWFWSRFEGHHQEMSMIWGRWWWGRRHICDSLYLATRVFIFIHHSFGLSCSRTDHEEQNTNIFRRFYSSSFSNRILNRKLCNFLPAGTTRSVLVCVAIKGTLLFGQRTVMLDDAGQSHLEIETADRKVKRAMN